MYSVDTCQCECVCGGLLMIAYHVYPSTQQTIQEQDLTIPLQLHHGELNVLSDAVSNISSVPSYLHNTELKCHPHNYLFHIGRVSLVRYEK